MKIVIAGGGRVGRVLSARLVTERHTVTVIDRDPAVCSELFDELGAVTICGDGTDARVLERAGLRAADVAAGLLPRDADNLAFATLTRSISSARVMVRMLDDSYKEAYRIAGARDIIAEADIVVGQMRTAIEFPQVLGSMPIGPGEAILFELTISPRALVADKTVAQARALEKFPTDCLFIGIVDREGRIELPTGSTQLRAGYMAVLAARRPDIPAVIECLAASGDGGATPSAALVAALRGVDFFAPLSADELSELLRGVEILHRQPGETIYRKGEPSEAFYVVLNGSVELVDEEGSTLTTIPAGGLFGETALLTGELRPTDARAASACELVAVGRDVFAQVVLANPGVALEMSRLLGQRLAEAIQAQPKRRRWFFGR